MVRFGFAHWNEELLVLAMEEIEMNSVMYQSMALFMKVQAWLTFKIKLNRKMTF